MNEQNTHWTNNGQSFIMDKTPTKMSIHSGKNN